MEPEALTKGTEVWTFQVRAWAFRAQDEWRMKVFDQPHIYHGVVTGGGPAQVLIEWDRSHGVVDRRSRHRQAAKLYATEREAVTSAIEELDRIVADAYERASHGNKALYHARLRLEKLDNPPVESEEERR